MDIDKRITIDIDNLNEGFQALQKLVFINSYKTKKELEEKMEAYTTKYGEEIKTTGISSYMGKDDDPIRNQEKSGDEIKQLEGNVEYLESLKEKIQAMLSLLEDDEEDDDY
jgi:hypothetical protein